jgi:DNA-binding response OmpR family regulator
VGAVKGEFMLQIVLATVRPKAWQEFAQALVSTSGVQLKQVASGAEALEVVRRAGPHLVIIDSALPDAAPLSLVRELLMVNAMVNTAVVSPLSDEEFHEASEGLGVLGRLPEAPTPNDADDLLQKLRMILGGI